MTAANVSVVSGHLSRAPEEVALASGELLVRYEITVPRDAERADQIPVIAVSPPAYSLGLDAGDEVVVVGRTRRRFWSAGGATRSQVEILTDAVIPARRKATVHRAIHAAVVSLTALSEEFDR